MLKRCLHTCVETKSQTPNSVTIGLNEYYHNTVCLISSAHNTVNKIQRLTIFCAVVAGILTKKLQLLTNFPFCSINHQVIV